MSTYQLRRPGARDKERHRFGGKIVHIGGDALRIDADAKPAEVKALKTAGVLVVECLPHEVSLPADGFGRPVLHVTLPDQRAVTITRGGGVVVCTLSPAEARDLASSGLAVVPVTKKTPEPPAEPAQDSETSEKEAD